MYGYICAILLLMCGKVYSDSYADAATQIGGDGCLYNGKYFSTGTHTVPQCMLMICDPNGQANFLSCPSVRCDSGKEIIGYQPETGGQSYPRCCPRPICAKLKPEEPYALPIILWE